MNFDTLTGKVQSWTMSTIGDTQDQNNQRGHQNPSCTYIMEDGRKKLYFELPEAPNITNNNLYDINKFEK